MSEATFFTTPTGDRIRDRFTVLVSSSMYQRGFDVLLCIALAAPITMEAKAADELQCMVIPPTLSGLAGQEFLQSALEAAWAAGLCPKNHRSAPMPNQPAERPAASCVSNKLLRDSVRQLNLSQLTHLSHEGIAPKSKLEEAIWCLTASEWLNHDSMRQMNLSQVADALC